MIFCQPENVVNKNAVNNNALNESAMNGRTPGVKA
jgi:hypothetical protein